MTATIGHSSNIDLSQAPSDFTVVDGDVLTGSTSHTVTIANNAKITLSNATISGGIVCEGTAEITLVGTNSVSNTWYSSAGIQIGGSGTTLTIKGDGSLTATGGSQAAGIGLGRTWDANATGGSVVIEGGTVTASGGNGIGTGTVGNSMTAHMDGIIIKGGTVNARLGKGTINNGSSVTIGAIKIYDTIDKVDASAITESVTYMHVENETETNVTASKTDYFTIIEDGDRRVITPKDDTDYTITIADDIEHGSIACAAATAKYGDKVTITATPDFGYRLSRLVVKDAQNKSVASMGNSFTMPQSNVTVSAVFEQGTHGTTEFAWGYAGPEGYVTDATIYDGVTTVNLQQERSYSIIKYSGYSYSKFLLDNDTYNVNIPYADGTGAFVLNGTSFNNNGEAGYYDITMTDAGNGKWSVSILKTVGQMDVVPDQTYTGSAITPEPLVMAGSLNLTKGTDYEYSYTDNTNVGTAKVTVTFKDDYETLGSVEKEFTIIKASNPATVTATAAVTKGRNTIDLSKFVTLNGATGTVSYTISGEANGCELNESTGIFTSGTDTGSVTINVTVSADNNYEALETKTITVTITDKATQTLTFDSGEVTKIYGDASFSNALNGGQTSISYGVTEGTNVAEVSSTGEVTIKAAGTATITATAEETTDYAGATASYTLTVNRKAVTVRADNKTIRVGETVPELTATVTGLVSGESESLISYTINREAGTDVGAYTITPVGETTQGNYTVSYETGTLTITNKPTYAVTVNNGSGDGSYVKGATVTITANDAPEGQDFDKWTTADGVTLADANSTTTTFTMPAKAVTVAATYKAKKTDPVITKAPAAISGLVYNGKAQALITAGEVTGGTLYYAVVNAGAPEPSAEPYTTSIPAKTDAGTYYVWYKVKGDTNHNDTEPQSVQVSVAKAPHSDQYANGSAKYGANGTVDLSAMIEEGGTVGTITKNDTNNVLDGDPSVSDGELNFVFAEIAGNATKTATVTVPVTSANYLDYNITVTLTVNAKDVPILTVDPITKTYDGAAVTGAQIRGTAKVNGTEIKGTWKFEYDANFVDAADSGAKKVIFTPEDTATYDKAEVMLALKINKAVITIKAADKSIYVGDTVPSLYSPVLGKDYTVTGLVGSDQLAAAPTLAYFAAPDNTKAGSYTITPGGAAVPASGNYADAISYQTGTLTIKAKSGGGSTGGGNTGGGGSSGGGGSTGGGNSGGGSPAPVTPSENYTVPVSGENTVEVTAEITNGNAVINEISKSDIDRIIESGSGSKSGEESIPITIDVSQAKSEVYSVELSGKTIERLTEAVNAKNNVESVEIKLTNATVTLDGAALSAVNEQAEGRSVTLAIEDTNTGNLNKAQQRSLKQFDSVKLFRAAFESGGKEIHDFKGGSVRVFLSFSPEKGREARHYHIYYLPKTGAMKRLLTYYTKGLLSFVTSHFSDYAIVYDQSIENGDPEDPVNPVDPEDLVNPEDPVELIEMHRLYNPNSGEHFFTGNVKEKDHLVELGWNYEGVAWNAPEKSKIPVYRLYNPNAGDHHYTTDVKERDHLIEVGWNDEGIGWYSEESETVALFRLYNPNALGAGAHHFTADAAERDHLIEIGWRDEKTGWYGALRMEAGAA